MPAAVYDQREDIQHKMDGNILKTYFGFLVVSLLKHSDNPDCLQLVISQEKQRSLLWLIVKIPFFPPMLFG